MSLCKSAAASISDRKGSFARFLCPSVGLHSAQCTVHHPFFNPHHPTDPPAKKCTTPSWVATPVLTKGSTLGGAAALSLDKELN